MNVISFPKLNLTFNINPVAFSIGAKDIYWYALIILTGFFAGCLFVYNTAEKRGLEKDCVWDISLYGLISGIIFARIYYVIFALDEFDSVWDMFKIWNGGLAIYGGIIGALISTAIYCKYKKISFKNALDVCCPGLFIGQAIGRWGNFVNQEAHGGVTSLPWRMGLTINGTYMEVHPTFLYESIWNVIGLLIARFILRNRRKFDGEIFLFYLAWYGLGRVWIEGLRTDSLYLFHTGIRVSQLLAGLCVLIAGGILIYLLIKLKPDAARLYVNQSATAMDMPAGSNAEKEETAEEQKEKGGAPHGSGDH